MYDNKEVATNTGVICKAENLCLTSNDDKNWIFDRKIIKSSVTMRTRYGGDSSLMNQEKEEIIRLVYKWTRYIKTYKCVKITMV